MYTFIFEAKVNPEYGQNDRAEDASLDQLAWLPKQQQQQILLTHLIRTMIY